MLAKLLSCNNKINYLDISNNLITNEGLTTMHCLIYFLGIVALFKVSNNNLFLNVSNNQISNDSIFDLKNINSLSFDGNNLDDTGFNHLLSLNVCNLCIIFLI